MAEEFQEDFFQRIKDVSWDTEPECFYAVGDGSLIVNNIAFASGSIWTSLDGIHWTQSIVNLDGSGGNVGGLYCGLWMRQGFRLTGKPVWLMGGLGLVDAIAGLHAPVVACSFDGCDNIKQVFFPPEEVNVDTLDVFRQTARAIASDQIHTSVDGINWSDSIAERGSPESGEIPAGASQDPVAGHEITAGGPDPSIKDNNQIWRQSATNAHGKVRQGRFKGRKLSIRGTGGDGSFFDSSMQISDNATGESLGTADIGLEKGHGISYGHYKFVVAGEHSGDGYISWSDDGLTWHPQRLSAFPCWPIVIGPRK